MYVLHDAVSWPAAYVHSDCRTSPDRTSHRAVERLFAKHDAINQLIWEHSVTGCTNISVYRIGGPKRCKLELSGACNDLDMQACYWDLRMLLSAVLDVASTKLIVLGMTAPEAVGVTTTALTWTPTLPVTAPLNVDSDLTVRLLSLLVPMTALLLQQRYLYWRLSQKLLPRWG